MSGAGGGALSSHELTVLLLGFAVALFVGVLISGLAHRSVLSTAALFLATGFLLGPGGFDLVPITSHSTIVLVLAYGALFGVLFTDGMHASVQDLRRAYSLPGRALIFGMPLFFGAATLVVMVLTPLDWTASMLVAAILTPTDPVFAEAIVGRDEVPYRLRHLLNVESGLNDGLALPFVLILLSAVQQGGGDSPLVVLGELAGGLAIGVVVPFLLLQVEGRRWVRAAGRYQSLNAVAIGLLVLALCLVTHANPFLAAFAAGSTVATRSPAARASFEGFGEITTELLKLGAVLVFGALLSVELVQRVGVKGWLVAVALLVVARPLSIVLALVGSRLPRAEWAAAAWFGPKGFASVTYGLLVVQADVREGTRIFDLVAATVGLSILAHSSTDAAVARVFDDLPEGDAPDPDVLAGVERS